MSTLSVAAKNAAVAAVTALIDAGSAAGTIEIRTGSKPASPDATATGTLLATLTFSDPAFAAPSAGSAAASAITSDTSVDATGTAGYARIKDSNGNAIVDLTVGTANTDLIFNSVSFIAGGTAGISTLTAVAS